MKDKFIETFTDIDDKYIAAAKPMAQKPIELRPETRRPTAAWKKITAAAACVAVLGGGSAVAVKLTNSQSGPGTSDISQNSSIAPNSSGNGSNSGNSPAYLLNNPDIEYQGTTYEVVNAANYDGVKMSVGFRQREYGRGSFVFGLIAIENTTDKPIILTPDGYASDWVDVDFGGLVNRSSDPFSYSNTIKPGEVYYQEMFYDTCTQEYEMHHDRLHSYKTVNLVEAGRYNGTAVLKYLADVDDPTREIIEHTMDFSIDIGDYNVGDNISGYLKPYRIDEELEKWGPETFTIREDFPGVEFEFDFRSISLINEDGSKTKLFGGEYIGNYCICDLNNDGYGEIVATVYFELTNDGNNAARSCVIAYDHKNKQLYAAAALDNYDIGEYVEQDKGTTGRGRVMINAMTLGDNAEQIYCEPLTFDMLKPCVLKENGEPMFLPLVANEDPVSFGHISKLNRGDKFEYEGKSYVVIDHSIQRSTTADNTIVGYDFVTGVRRETIDGTDTAVFVAVFENNTNESVQLWGTVDKPDLPFVLSFETDVNVDLTDDVEFANMAYELSPGDVYYQEVYFPLTAEGEYIFSAKCNFGDGGHTGSLLKAEYSSNSISFNNIGITL